MITKRIIVTTLIVLSLAIFGAVPVFAQTNAKDSACQGIGAASGTGGSCSAPVGTPSIDSAIATGINILSVIVAIIAVVMIMIGGIKYVTSQGDPSNTKSARDTILYAIVGLIVVALAQVIVRFVLHRIH